MAYRLRRGIGAYSPQVQAIAQAIAKAEGGTIPGTLPYRTNNPCDIFPGGNKSGFSSMDDGWNACYGQVSAILSGSSSYYTPDEPISSIAQTYTGNDNPTAWANIVSSALGLSPSDPLTAAGGATAQNPPDSSTGLQTPDTGGGFDLSTLLSPAAADSGSITLLLDASGNLTGWAWAGIVAAGGLVLWAALR